MANHIYLQPDGCIMCFMFFLLLKVQHEDRYKCYPAPETRRLEDEDNQQIYEVDKSHVGGTRRSKNGRRESSSSCGRDILQSGKLNT